MKFLAIIVIAVVIETLMQWLKQAFPEIRTGVIFLITQAFGILLAFTFDADLFASVGLTARIAFVGNIVTGMACGAGSNVVYDILKAISGGVKKIETEYFMQKDLTGIDPGYEEPYTDTDEGMM